MDARINALYDAETNAPMINDAINVIVNTIQNDIITHKLSRHLKAIMNSWVRTHSWYNEDKMSKFEHCLRNVVSREMRSRVIDLLKVQDKEYGVGRCVNEDDLALEVLRVSMSQSTSNYFWDFWDINTKLTLEADRCRRSNGECLIERDFDRPFSWFSKRTMSTHYHLPHVPKHLKNIDVVPLEVLTSNFKHDPGWDCSICLEVDSVNSVCVRTACKHIFHMGCLDNCKRVYLQQKANFNKTCVPCPLCRVPIH
jgi:hypothetical protein